ncbi:phosphate ABC transporter substrate-binding protein PstS [Desulfobacter hydrogenophilus]|uniref:Phosphate-binding protein n=1 Tax=Desulfobacter hydrogenophilus TaxID=2291 RepID=A0A328F7Z4_9BACT|nr:phosphate ABC transporter substrate-binding protein PstS [Desulfobacter hydrogenophilus]NDY73413.1 phosphate ABC transporter substrate-binding protein PstS [Desulfobacter hydrogenophilus]QBH12420.1 phosphate ABC transporter substrate-binding protein PstS [Desulfobacter hydrogenophilus]RAM00741.1 phosphate ABC transporter substrate-binding protein PstS [Desulfobacter hydrogenophilus]
MKLKSLFNVALSAAVAASFMVVGFATAGTTKITGAGASFPAPIYSEWFKDLAKQNNGEIKVDYQSIGSGSGIKNFIGHTVDFGASDAAMKQSEIDQVPEGVQLLPMTAGEIVLAYNLPGIEGLKLPRDVYPEIFLGNITKWNDAKIVAANPGVELPDTPITVVVRSDKSGTTFGFTGHLSAISSDFQSAVGQGKMVQWPAKNMVKGKKNDGVSSAVRQTPGAIGYTEYGFAKLSRLPMACLENKAGKFVCPGPEGGAAALANAVLPENMIVFINDPAGDASYPIATFTWMLFYKKNKSAELATALRKMVEYCLDEGQKIADKAGYIPLPESVVEKVRAASNNIQ